jgi:hypothetical protein
MAATNFTKFIGRLGRNEESDECYTPKNEVWPLFEFLDKSKTYYEATSTHSGSIVNGLKDGGFNVVGNEGRDFFECGAEDVFDGVVTNPPYSKKDQFIKHCYDLGKPFALLLPVAAFQGQKRGKWFNEFGISALVLNRRIDFTGGDAPTFGVAWFMGNGMCEPGRIWFVEN